MKRILHIGLCALLLAGLASCGSKKNLTTNTNPEPAPEQPTWHTCLIQNARATVQTSKESVSATVTMQTVRDSMLIISVMPMLGIEMLRVEATPSEFIAINKLEGWYVKGTYEELNRAIRPALSWQVLQQLCTAELPTGSEQGRVTYSFGEETLDLTVSYPERKLDVPVRMNPLRLNKYKQVDASKWIK